MRLIQLLFAAAILHAQSFDTALNNGRVIDPESGLDAVRSVGIRGGRIAAISETPLRAAKTLDARGLIVAPGFIDLHSHGQTIPAGRMQAFDGVTTALELELGLLPVAEFYANAAKQGRPINYGASSSWAFARIAVKENLKPEPVSEFFRRGFALKGWQYSLAEPPELERILAMIEQGLKEGGVGIGMNAGYAPGYGRKENYQVNRLAARYGVPTFTHIRYMSAIEPQSSAEAYIELAGVAAATGAHMHICHFNSTSGRDIALAVEIISGAQKRGAHITVEAYPYGAGSSGIGAELFRGENWQGRTGMRYEDFEYEGHPLDERSFTRLQRERPGATIVLHFMHPETNPADQALLDKSVLYPGGAIASDSMHWQLNGKTLQEDVWPLPPGAFAHPRSAGTFTRFLRQYVRERNAISLPEAIRKMTLIPAQILEESTPQMRGKGRIRVGADADLVAFDLATVGERATFTQPAQTANGMRYVLVNGVLLIEDAQLIRAALPGKPVRRPQVSN